MQIEDLHPDLKEHPKADADTDATKPADDSDRQPREPEADTTEVANANDTTEDSEEEEMKDNNTSHKTNQIKYILIITDILIQKAIAIRNVEG